MPEITRFFGIIIRMYGESGERHSVPNLHAYYQEYSVVYGIDPIVCLASSLPRRRRRLLEAWMDLHQKARVKNWELIDSVDYEESWLNRISCV